MKATNLDHNCPCFLGRLWEWWQSRRQYVRFPTPSWWPSSARLITRVRCLQNCSICPNPLLSQAYWLAEPPLDCWDYHYQYAVPAIKTNPVLTLGHYANKFVLWLISKPADKITFLCQACLYLLVVSSCMHHSSGAVWEWRWASWAVRPNELSGFRGSKAILNHASALVSACP